MFPTDEDRSVSVEPLLAEVIQDILDKSNVNPVEKVKNQDILDKSNVNPVENHIVVERVGDSNDEGPLQETAASPVPPIPLSEAPADGPAPASVPLNCLSQGKQKKSSLRAPTKPKMDALAKEKLRQRMRLMFAPDVATPDAKHFKQPKDSKLGTKLRPSTDMARLETRLETLTKRVLALESNMDTLCLKMSF